MYGLLPVQRIGGDGLPPPPCVEHFASARIITAFRIHKELGSRLSGIHLELTGEDVTECIGGPGNLSESDLTRDYRSQVDPRLNYEQAMEIAFLIAEQMR